MEKLKVAVVGGLGLMASPMARHWMPEGPVQVVRVHDRGNPGERRDRCRNAWREHGASLVGTLEELVGNGDLDGVFVCCGKNGDDILIISSLAKLLSKTASKKPFICHMSTVSANFVKSAHAFCALKNVRYANYPLTGGVISAEKGTMLILASGSRSLFDELTPALSCLGNPKHFGEEISSGAEVKFIGHLMVFNGLIAICSAAAAHAQCFTRGSLGIEQAHFLDFLNSGAGGTRQWEVTLSSGLKQNIWDGPFLIRYGVVDAIYTAQLCIDRGLSRFVVDPILHTALAFSYILNHVDPGVATQAIVKELVQSRARDLDAFMMKHSDPQRRPKEGLDRCLESLPKGVRDSAALDVQERDFY